MSFGPNSGLGEDGDQTACKPGSVPSEAEAADIGDHSSGPPLAGRFSRPTRTARACDSPTPIAGGARPLFGLAPGGACHATTVTSRPVGSYPTLSPFPRPKRLGSRWFAFCGAIPGVAPGGRYPPPCRSGARTFLDPLAEAAIARPSGPRGKWSLGAMRSSFAHSQSSSSDRRMTALGRDYSRRPIARSSSTVPSASRTRLGKRPSISKPRRW